MSATIARQGGWVQLEQADMHLALNMAKMAKEGFSHAKMEEMKHLIKKPQADVQEEKKQGVEFPGHIQVNAAIERHPAMFQGNQMDGCILHQNATAKNLQTRWSCSGMHPPPPELVLPPPGTPPALPGNNE